MKATDDLTQIKSIDRIVELASNGKAVYCSRLSRYMPAAFIQNWQARLLHKWIVQGVFFEKAEDA